MEGEIFDWKTLFKGNSFEAAGVSIIKHAPGAKVWNECVTIGMKLIVKHQDLPPIQTRRKHAFWVVTVVEIRGYYCRVRYEGLEQDDQYDFWIHLCKHDVHAVGAEIKNMVLIPPKYLGKALDWRTYFMNCLPESSTLPLDFFNTIRNSIFGSKYRIGTHLEVLDKYKISQFRVAKVSKILGRRMYMRYLGDCEDGFFCHEESSLIHSLGWASCVGHDLQAPDWAVTSISASAKAHDSKDHKNGLSEGMKLEVVDPLCPSRISAATICKVLQFNYMMIKVDSYDETKGASECFCYHLNSPYIFNCGFCQSNAIPLVPPFGQHHGKFSWKEYLKENNCLTALIPEKPKIEHGFSVGMKLEMVDVMIPTKIHVASIVQIVGRLLRINFDGWEPEYDQWLDAESPDIYPIGWCALVGHQLEGPRRNAAKTN